MRWGDFKPKLADALVAHLQPIQVRECVCAGAGAGAGKKTERYFLVFCIKKHNSIF